MLGLPPGIKEDHSPVSPVSFVKRSNTDHVRLRENLSDNRTCGNGKAGLSEKMDITV